MVFWLSPRPVMSAAAFYSFQSEKSALPLSCGVCTVMLHLETGRGKTSGLIA